MPVVGHQRVSTNPHRRFIAHFTQDALERLVVRRLLEQLHSGNATIQNVKYHPTRSDPCCSWHRGTIAKNTPSCQYRTCPAFSAFSLGPVPLSRFLRSLSIPDPSRFPSQRIGIVVEMVCSLWHLLWGSRRQAMNFRPGAPGLANPAAGPHPVERARTLIPYAAMSETSFESLVSPDP